LKGPTEPKPASSAKVRMGRRFIAGSESRWLLRNTTQVIDS